MSAKITTSSFNKQKNNNISEELNIINDLYDKFDLEKIREINIKSVDLIFDDKPKKSLELLKKLESFFENKIIDIKEDFNKKILIIILHNIACCYQKIKDYDKCINYLDAVIFHFDNIIEKKHNIKINEQYFNNLIKTPNYKYDKQLLGDLILELRFCAKFHLQMGVLLSESEKHLDSLYHIKLAALICEDNLIKTKYLYNQLKDSFINNNQNNNDENNEITNIKEQIKNNYKIIMELNQIVLNLRDNNKIYKNINVYNKNKKI